MIARYNDSRVSLEVSSSDLQNTPEYKEAVREVEECIAITDAILEQFSQIDSSIRQFKEGWNKVGDGGFRIMNNLLDNGSSIKNDYAAGLVGLVAMGAGAIGLVAKGVGLVAGGIKEHKAKKQYEEAMDAALEKKKEIANEKYPHILGFQEKFREKLIPRIEKLYSKEFETVVNVNDPLLEKRVSLFKGNLGLVIKTRYLDRTLDYILNEMRAWKSGKHNSDVKSVDIQKILMDELSNWPVELGNGGTWDQFVTQQMENTSEAYPVAVALLFGEPAFLSNYVGINLPIVNNCSKALIQAKEKDSLDFSSAPFYKLIKNNSYYLDCKENLEKNLNPPPYPKPFDWVDGTILSLCLLFVFGISIIGFIVFPGSYVLARVVTIALAVFCLSALIETFGKEPLMLDLLEIEVPHTSLPYEDRYSEYSNEFDSMVKTISDREQETRKSTNIVKK